MSDLMLRQASKNQLGENWEAELYWEESRKQVGGSFDANGNQLGFRKPVRSICEALCKSP